MRKFFTAIFEALKGERESVQTEWIDPTGVLVTMTHYDCDECAAPGWECVDKTQCPRSDHFVSYRAKAWVS